jgi:hypothetical protein
VYPFVVFTAGNACQSVAIGVREVMVFPTWGVPESVGVVLLTGAIVTAPRDVVHAPVEVSAFVAVTLARMCLSPWAVVSVTEAPDGPDVGPLNRVQPVGVTTVEAGAGDTADVHANHSYDLVISAGKLVHVSPDTVTVSPTLSAPAPSVGAVAAAGAL